jgi:hypothetical protein
MHDCEGKEKGRFPGDELLQKIAFHLLFISRDKICNSFIFKILYRFSRSREVGEISGSSLKYRG